MTYSTCSMINTHSWMRQSGTDHNCLVHVLINCQYLCTSSSSIYDPKVDGYVFLIVPV